MITVMGATGQTGTGRKIAESLLKVGEKARALGRSESKLSKLPHVNPTAGKPSWALYAHLWSLSDS